MNADEDLACQEPDEYAQKLNEKYQKELQLLRDYNKRQYLMSDEEFQNSNELVPWRWHTSLNPELQWRLDNLKCECGICHNLSGTKDKNCWVFTELGCGFSVAVRKFFAFSSRKSDYVTPIFDPVTKK